MTTVHYLVVRSRDGFSVNVEADTLSIHDTEDEARRMADLLARLASDNGEDAAAIDVVAQSGSSRG